MTRPSPGPGRALAVASALAAAAGVAAWAEFAYGWTAPAFDAVAHLFFEVPVLAAVRRPTQLPLFRGHLALFWALLVLSAIARPGLSPHARRCLAVVLVAYAVRASVWVAGGNLPLVPGDSCHYLEVSTSVYRGEGPVKHYVESYFRDYPAVRQNRGVLDDWATPLYAYVLACAYRLAGVVPGASLEATVGVAKGVSFVCSMLTLAALYGFARRRFDGETALAACAVLAVLPVHAIYAGFALRESLVCLACVLAVWGLTEVWSAARTRDALAWAVVAGLFTGLAVLARNTALALAAGAGLHGLWRHGRRRFGPLLLWGLVAAVVVTPWAWATFREYGRPFYTYTDYFPYNFSWTVHHYEKGNTTPAEFYTRANAPEIVRVKLKSLAIIVVTATMIFSLPLTLGVLRRLRGGRCGDADRLVALVWVVFVAATLANVADVTQVSQLGRYYLPLFVLTLPTAVAGLRGLVPDGRVRPWLAVSLVALLWADPTWAYDAGWLVKPNQLHWPALREAADWVKAHPEAVPPDARVLTWFPWEFRVAADRTTVLFPRNYSLNRVDEVARQYGVTHVLWGSFEPPPHLDPESWAPYLRQLRLGAGLTDDRALHASPRSLLYPVTLYRVR